MAQFSSALPDSSAWRQLYEAAILELDNRKLLKRISEARTAIHIRAEEILTSASLGEHRALEKALHALQIIEEVSARQKPPS